MEEIDKEIMKNGEGYYQAVEEVKDGRVCNKNLKRRLDYLLGREGKLKITKVIDNIKEQVYEVIDNELYKIHNELYSNKSTLCICGQKINHIFIVEQLGSEVIRIQIGGKCIERFNKDLGQEAARLVHKMKKTTDEKCYICNPKGLNSRGGLIQHLFSKSHLERMKAHLKNQIRNKKLKEGTIHDCMDCKKEIPKMRGRPRCMDCWKHNNIKKKLLIN